MLVQGAFPLRPLLRIDSDFHAQIYEKFINYLQSPQLVTVRGDSPHAGEKLTISAIPCDELFKERFLTNEVFRPSINRMIWVNGEFEYPGDDDFQVTSSDGRHISREEKRLLWKDFLLSYLDLTVQTFLSSMMIAFPGAVRPIRNFWFIDEERQGYSNYYLSSFDDAADFLFENGLPLEMDIRPESAMRWVFSQNGVFNGYSDTPSSRAFNYFTRLFVQQHRNDELGDLVWALAGIEALLVEKGRSSLGQLKSKLFALFVPGANSKWFEKMIDRTYNFRSRMVHGDRQIKSEFRSEEEELKKRFDEQYESSRFAIGLLLAVLQKCVKLNVKELRFETRLQSE